MRNKIGGCVVLYNPDARVASNIQSYCDGVEILFVIDNSPEPDRVLVDVIKAVSPRIVYSWMGENKGLAGALNVAVTMATGQDCDWLLTMDQDSCFLGDDITRFVTGIESQEKKFGKIGILSPVHIVNEDFRPDLQQPAVPVRFAMTSGNLLNLEAARAVGPFEEKLFIDCVDMEYCLRLRKAGFGIVQDNTVRLQHSLGDFRTGNFLGMKMGYSNHNAIRRYYITRNRIYILRNYFRQYPGFGWLVVRSMAGDLIRIVFFEKQKMSKLRSILSGCRDAVTGHYGKYVPKGIHL